MAMQFFEMFDDDEIEEMNEEYEKERSQYSNWIFNKTSYAPAIEIEITKKVQPGIYKLNNDMQMVPSTISSDVLFKLPDSETNHIIKEVNTFLDRKEAFKKANLIHKRGFLLVGPPGTGKSSIITLVIKEIVEKYNGVVFLINNVADFTKTFDFLKGTFRRIEPDTFVVTIIEDIDKINNDHIEPEVLDFFDGKASINHHLIISTSNDTSELPDALLRPSRIDRKFYIGNPSEESRYEFFKNKGVEENLLDEFVKNSVDMSISELKELFIGTYVMGLPMDEVVADILEPFEKQEYKSKDTSKSTIEF